jgi:hypothetical protein
MGTSLHEFSLMGQQERIRQGAVGAGYAGIEPEVRYPSYLRILCFQSRLHEDQRLPTNAACTNKGCLLSSYILFCMKSAA